MLKRCGLMLLGAGILAGGGCGGSSHTVPVGTSLKGTDFGAALPDGGELSLDFDTMANGQWSGDYEFLRASEPTADDDGRFTGTNVNGHIQAVFTSLSGNSFNLTGTVNGTGFDLTRADDPGTTYHFSPPTMRAGSSGRGSVTFRYTFRGMRNFRGAEGGGAEVSDNYATEGSLKLYEGTLDGNRVQVVEVPASNYFLLRWWVNDYDRCMTVFDGTFNSLRSGNLYAKTSPIVPEVVTRSYIGQVYSGGFVSH